MRPTTTRGLLALSPIAIFLTLYLAVSVAIGDFYKMPLSLAFIVAAVWGIITTPKATLTERITLLCRGAADSDILYMIWIFMLAGAFSSLARDIGAIQATVNLALTIIPVELALPGLFLAACFISLSIGTSVGTIVALTPLAVQLAQATGASAPLLVAVTLGGSFFGDNLSFISDTTIAATRSQKCKMSDKFKANLWIALPAAVIALAAYTVTSLRTTYTPFSPTACNPWLVLPYLIVIITATAGVNVLVVLLLGILASLIIALTCTATPLLGMCTSMGAGIDSMGNLIIVTLLAAGLLELIRHNGGIQFIIQWLTRRISGKRGAITSIAALVSIVNVCTANNTIAIITVGSIARRVSQQFHLDNRRVASILDTCSCITQCLLPYGAQALLAAGIASLAPVAFLPYLYYAWALALMVALSIIFRFPKSQWAATAQADSPAMPGTDTQQ